MKTHYFSHTEVPGRFKAAGMTLIEISLVIALLLGLITVAFIGIGSYRKGADKARCKMQLAAVQKAVRAYANFNNLAIGAALANGDVFKSGGAVEVAPVCPSGGAYTWVDVVPAVGTGYGDCDYVDGDGVTIHALSQYTDLAEW